MGHPVVLPLATETTDLASDRTGPLVLECSLVEDAPSCSLSDDTVEGGEGDVARHVEIKLCSYVVRALPHRAAARDGEDTLGWV